MMSYQESQKKQHNESFSEDVVYLIKCSDWDSAIVLDGSNIVAHGNSWDFHKDCHGLTSYKNIKLGDWRGAGSLAELISKGLKKDLRGIKTNPMELNLFSGLGLTAY